MTRIEAAKTALESYRDLLVKKGYSHFDDDYDTLTALITDLLHLADGMLLPAHTIVHDATETYEKER